MSKPRNIFLIGPMGAGKSTIGKYVARELQLDFYDSDKEIEERCGANIPWIFDVEGEAGFRRREEQIIAELATKEGVLLATGGGAVLSTATRTVLTTRGIVIFLQTSIEQQVQRTAKDRNRPLLQGGDVRAKLESLRSQREPLYKELADYTFQTDGRSVRAVANEIIETLRS